MWRWTATFTLEAPSLRKERWIGQQDLLELRGRDFFRLGSELLRMLALGMIATGNFVSHTLVHSDDTGMVKSIAHELVHT